MMRVEHRESPGICVARACIALFVFLAVEVSATTVWTWVDKNGVKHYSQIPAPGATRVDIGPSNRATAYVPASASSQPDDAQRPTAAPASVQYTEFSITRPADDEALSNVGGVVPVSVRLDPALRPGHDLVFYLDDRSVEPVALTAGSFELKDVPRGTHLLVGVVRDERRAPLQEAAVTFHVRQTSIAKPPGSLKPVQPGPVQPPTQPPAPQPR